MDDEKRENPNEDGQEQIQPEKAVSELEPKDIVSDRDLLKAEIKNEILYDIQRSSQPSSRNWFNRISKPRKMLIGIGILAFILGLVAGHLLHFAGHHRHHDRGGIVHFQEIREFQGGGRSR